MTDEEIDYWYRAGLRTGYANGFSDGKVAAILAVGEVKPDTETWVDSICPKKDEQQGESA